MQRRSPPHEWGRGGHESENGAAGSPLNGPDDTLFLCGVGGWVGWWGGVGGGERQVHGNTRFFVCSVRSCAELSPWNSLFFRAITIKLEDMLDRSFIRSSKIIKKKASTKKNPHIYIHEVDRARIPPTLVPFHLIHPSHVDSHINSLHCYRTRAMSNFRGRGRARGTGATIIGLGRRRRRRRRRRKKKRRKRRRRRSKKRRKRRRRNNNSLLLRLLSDVVERGPCN